MGDLKSFNSAGVNDSPDTITSHGGLVGRVSDLFLSKQEAETLQSAISQNTEAVTEVVADAPETLNSFKEVSDNLDVDAFLAALEGE